METLSGDVDVQRSGDGDGVDPPHLAAANATYTPPIDFPTSYQEPWPSRPSAPGLDVMEPFEDNPCRIPSREASVQPHRRSYAHETEFRRDSLVQQSPLLPTSFKPLQQHEFDDPESGWPRKGLWTLGDRDSPPFLQQHRSAIAVACCCVALLLAFALGQRYAPDSVAGAAGSASAFHSDDMLLGGVLPGARNTFRFSNGTQWERDPKLKIVAIIFFGRRQFVDILDCYLRRHLAVNGGLLDEVHFLMHTDVETDKDWLEKLVKDHHLQDQYILKHEKTDSPGWDQWGSYAKLYQDYMLDPNTIYIKMDDDVLFVSDAAIPELIRTTLEYPSAHSVLANVVNNKRSHWFHYRSGAIHPFLPDRKTTSTWPATSWRTTDLASYSDPLPKKNTWFSSGYPPPFVGHRWLPLRSSSPRDAENSASLLAHTPFSGPLPDPTYILHGPGVGWSVAAQAHYSLLENLERGELSRYYFGSPRDGAFNLWYMRWNINMLAISGANLARRPFWGAAAEGKIDEEMLTEVIPRELDMPALVATRAVVAHFSFKGDRDGMMKTDVLDRYRAYANEMVCARGNRKNGFGRKNPHHEADGGKEEDDSGAEGGDGEIGDGPGDEENGDEGDDGDAVDGGGMETG